jgi:sec-independent protein translocase protein TatA
LKITSIKGRRKMFGLGMPELIIILLIILVIFGAGKLSRLGGDLGQGIKNFRKAMKEPEETDKPAESKKD